jgi:hypothetical protein
MNRDFTGNMRPGQKNRGRGGRNNMGGGYNPNRQGGGRGPHRPQNFDSNGPSVKIRGNAYQVFERYIAMAREAASAGDRISAENLYQHAEHYYRIMQANGEGYNQQNQRPMTPADNEMPAGEDGENRQGQPQQQQGQPHQQQGQPQQQHQQQQAQPQQQHAAPAQGGPQPPAPPADNDYLA